MSAILSLFLSVPAQALKYSIPIGLTGGLGAMGDGGNYKSRTMSMMGIHMMPSLTFKRLMIGPMVQLRFNGQITDPTGVSDVNLGGYAYEVGFGLGWIGTRFRFRASYDFMGSDFIFVPASDGSSASYGKGSGYNLFVSYKIKPTSKVTFDLQLSYHQYKENTISNATHDISGGMMKQVFCALGLSYWISPKSSK